MKCLVAFAFMLVTCTCFADWSQNNQTHYTYAGLTVLREQSWSSTVTYTPGLARTDASDGTTIFYHSDGISTTAAANSSGTVVAQYTYDPFGNMISKSGSQADANTTRFGWREFNSTSWLYTHSYRFYNPMMHRWINRDPIGLVGGLNKYAFVGNNPVSNIDPLGLNSEIVQGPNGRPMWVGPYDQRPQGMQFGLWWGNEEFKPPGSIWGQDQYGNPTPIPNDIMGLQPSLLGEMLLPTGAGLLAKPSWLTGMKVPARSMCLYRAVSRSELDDIAKYGFRPGPNSLLAKSFATTAEDAARFGRDLFKLDQQPFFIVEANVDRSVLNYATQMSLDWKSAVVIPFQRLQSFNWAVNGVTSLPSIPIR